MPIFDDSEKNRKLLKFIRLSRKDGDFTCPDEDTITAYLMGTASLDQENTVKDALIKSKEFRQEILQLATEIDTINQSYLQKNMFQRLWEKASKHKIRYVLIPSLSAAMVLLLISISFFPQIVRKTDIQLADKDKVIDSLQIDIEEHPDSLRQEQIIMPDDETREYALEDEYEFEWREAAYEPPEIPPMETCRVIHVNGSSPNMVDSKLAQQEASRKAYYGALSRGIEDHYGIPVNIRNNRDLTTALLTYNRGFISDYEVINYGLTENDQFGVTVNATYCPGNLQGSIKKKIIHLMNQIAFSKPKILVYFLGNEDEKIPRFTLISAFSKTLLKSGFRVYEPVPDEKDIQFFDKIFQNKDMTLQIGDWSKPGSDIIIGIRIDVSDPQPAQHEYLKNGWFNTDVSIGFRAVDGKTGRILLANTFVAIGLGGSKDQAQENGLRKAAERVVNEISDDFMANIDEYSNTVTVDCRSCTEQEFHRIDSVISELSTTYASNIENWDAGNNSGVISVKTDPLIGSTELVWLTLKSVFKDTVNLESKSSNTIVLSGSLEFH